MNRHRQSGNFSLEIVVKLEFMLLKSLRNVFIITLLSQVPVNRYKLTIRSFNGFVNKFLSEFLLRVYTQSFYSEFLLLLTGLSTEGVIR